MADNLTQWQVKYLKLLQEGKLEDDVCVEINVPYDVVRKEERENPVFANALDMVRAGVGMSMLAPGELSAVLEAQADDRLAAAFFGMTLEEFTKTISADVRLKRVYDTSRDKGKAKMLMSAYGQGLKGDSKMITHFLQFHNGMVEKKAETEVNVSLIEGVEDMVRMLAFINQAKDIGAVKTIDGDSSEVKEFIPVKHYIDEDGLEDDVEYGGSELDAEAEK